MFTFPSPHSNNKKAPSYSTVVLQASFTSTNSTPNKLQVRLIIWVIRDVVQDVRSHLSTLDGNSFRNLEYKPFGHKIEVT